MRRDGDDRTGGGHTVYARGLTLALALLTALLAFRVPAGAAPAPGDTGTCSTIRSDISGLGRDAAAIPGSLGNHAWLAAAGAVGGTVLLFTEDQALRDLAARNHSGTADKLADAGMEYGRAIYGLSLAAGLYSGGLLFRHEPTRETGIMLFESLALAGVTGTVLKSLAGRSRPYNNEGAWSYHPFEFNDNDVSLPSGHTLVAFSVSTVLAGRIGHPAATAALYSMAVITAWSRVYDDEHWTSDTFLGAAIGTFSGLIVTKLHNHGTEDAFSLRITPVPGGLQLAYYF